MLNEQRAMRSGKRAMRFSETAEAQVLNQHSHIIKRDIADRLVEGLSSLSRLALLVAPAGSGKTLLAKQILNQYSEISDQSFYIDAGALPREEKYWAKVLSGMLLTDDSIQSFTELQAAVCSQPSLLQERLIVIDNTDALRGHSLWLELKQLIKGTLSLSRFVLVSRYDMAEDFARQKSEGIVMEIDFKQLAFSSVELGLLAKSMSALASFKQRETQDFLDALLQKSHGWPAGAVIGLQAVKNGHCPKAFVSRFCGKDRDVVSYFRENVMRDIGEDCADLLLQCSLGNQIDDRYIQHVMGRCDTTRIKELIASENAFVIECDRNRDSLSLHPLFREFLEYEFSFRDQERCQALKKKHQEINGQSEQAHAEVVYADFGGMTEKLTDRETQLVQLISAGFTNREIGEKLFISEKTVKWHLHKIYAKMGVKNRTTAIAKARSCQMIN